MTVNQAIHNPDARWLSIAEAARFLNVSEAQVRARIRLGEIHAERFFGRVAVLEASVREFQRRRGEEA